MFGVKYKRNIYIQQRNSCHNESLSIENAVYFECNQILTVVYYKSQLLVDGSLHKFSKMNQTKINVSLQKSAKSNKKNQYAILKGKRFVKRYRYHLWKINIIFCIQCLLFIYMFITTVMATYVENSKRKTFSTLSHVSTLSF